MVKCDYGVPIHAIGISINCITCDRLTKDGYCSKLKTRRIAKESEEKKNPTYCKECQLFVYTKTMMNRLLWDGFCSHANMNRIARNKLSKACDKGILIPHLRTKVKELDYRLGI